MLNRGKLKYFLCIALTLVITASVVLAPYLYYYVWDNHYETYFYGDGGYSFDDADGDATFDDIRALVLSPDAIWVNEYANLSDEDVYNETQTAVKGLLEGIGENKYISGILNEFLENEDLYIDYYEFIVVSGTVNGLPVSVSMGYAFMISDTHYAYVLYNRKNDKVYQFEYSLNEFNDSVSSMSADEYQDMVEYLNCALPEYEESIKKTYAFSCGGTNGCLYLYAFGSNYNELRSKAGDVVNEYDNGAYGEMIQE